MNRILTIIAMLLVMTGQAQAATYYKIKVAGVEVNSNNKTSITSDRIKAYKTSVNGGLPSVTYSGDANGGTLTLYNVYIQRDGSGNRAILNDGNPGLTVVLKGENYLGAEDSSPVRLNANTTVKSEMAGGSNKTTIVGGDEDALTIGNGSTVTLKNANLELMAESSCFESANGLPTLIIEDSEIYAHNTKAKNNDCYAIHDYKMLTVKNSTVHLAVKPTGIPVVSNLQGYTQGPGMYAFYNSSEDLAEYSSSLGTFINRSHNMVEGYVKFKMGIPINSTNFEDATFRSYVSSYIDASHDGYLIPQEMNQTVLSVNNMGISSLKGMELFTKLQRLECWKNNLSKLDLTKNQDLAYVYCDNNQISTLTVSGTANQKLRTIRCDMNRLRGAAMEALVSNLPTVTEGTLSIMNTEEDANTGNYITMEQVSRVKAKKWSVKLFHGDTGVSTDFDGVPPGLAIDGTNFPDANFRAWLGSNADSNHDGYLSNTELEMRLINVSNQGIASLSGIEFFTRLSTLDCSNNQLKSLDVSNHTELTGLWCQDNQLTSLSVSVNKELRFLYCGNNRLSVIDLRQNTKLEKLYCGNCMIGNLYLPETTTLNIINCVNNRLKNLDLSKCPNLTFVNCSENQLNGLNLTNCTGLTEIYCAYNQLTGLQLTNYTKLDRLYCHHNRLTSLTVTGCKQLKELVFNNNSIREAGMSELVTSLPSVTWGNFCVVGEDELPTPGNYITVQLLKEAADKGWDASKMLTSGSMVEYAVDATGIAIDETNFPSYYFRLYVSSELDSDNDGYLSDEEIAAVKKIEGGLKNFETLKGVEFFTELTELECYCCRLTELDLSKNTKLTYLDCSYNQLTSLDLSKNTKLTEVYIEDNWIGGSNMTAFANSLPQAKNGFLSVYELKSMDEHNSITAEQVAIMTAKGWNVYYFDDHGDYTLYSPVLDLKIELYRQIDIANELIADAREQLAKRYPDPEAYHHMLQLIEFANQLQTIMAHLEATSTVDECQTIMSEFTAVQMELAEYLEIIKIYINGEATGISDASRQTNKEGITNERSGETHNLSGQRVGRGYKGIVIVNGKKRLNK